MSDLELQFTSFSDEAIDGWAYDPANVGRRLVFALSIDGLFERRVKVNLRRRVRDADVGNPRIRFNASLPPILRDGSPHLVQLHEVETGRLLREETVTTRSIHYRDRGGGVAFATVTALDARRVRGWAISAGGPVTIELEIDGVLVASQPAGDTVAIDRDYPAGFAFLRLPHALYDGAEHEIAVYARLAERTLIGCGRVVLAPADAPRLTASTVHCADGGIHGHVVDPRAPRRPLTLALSADGVEIACTRSDPASEEPGRFRFDLTGPQSVDWLAAELRLISLPDGMDLPLPHDAVRRGLRVGRAPDAGLVIDSPLPLPALLPVVLTAADGVTARMVLRGEGRMRLALPLRPELRGRTGLSVAIAGVTLAVSDKAVPIADEPPRRRLFVPPLRDLTRRVLSAFSRGEKAEAASGVTGAWRLRGRSRLEGWAVDLATPDRPVAVALHLDGRPIGTVVADRPAVPREARIEAVLPIGFSFDVSGLAAGQVEARIAGGASLLPGAPQRLPATDPAIAVLREIDGSVARGDLAAAYLRARGAAARGGVDMVDRFLVLDHALRAEWAHHAAFLATWAPRASLGLADRLATGEAWQDDGLLPSAYGDLLRRAVANDAEALAGRAMLWSVLSQLPDDATARPADVVLVPGFDRTANRPVARALAAFARAGGRIAETVPDDAKFVVHLAAPRLIDATALGYWPALLTARGAGVATCATIAAGPVDADSFELLGRVPDPAVRLPAASAGAAPAELLTFAVEVPDGDAWPLVALEITDADAAVAELEASETPETAAVILRLPGIAYPPDYADRAFAAFRAAGGDRSVVDAARDYEPRNAAFVAGERMPDRSFLGLTGAGCYLLADLVRSRRAHGAFGADGIVVSTARPFVVAPLGVLASIPEHPGRAAHAKGFFAHQVGNWHGAAAVAGFAEPVDVPVARSTQRDLASGAFRFATVRRLARTGHIATAADMTLAMLDDLAGLLSGGSSRYLDLLQAVKLLGLQADFHRRIGPSAPLLLACFPEAILPTFEVVATAARPDEVAALVTASLARLSLGETGAPVDALAAAAVRFLSVEALVAALAIIDDSPHRALLHAPHLAAEIGRALLAAPHAAFRLPFTGLEAGDFRDAAPPLRQATAALVAGDRGRFITRLAQSLRQDELRSVVLALRTYTAELRALDLQPDEIVLPAGGDPALLRQLTALLGRDVPGDDAAAIVSASAGGAFALLDAAFAQWAAPYGVQPVTFAGRSIEAVFAGLAAQPLPAEAPSVGRVSVLMTVYNPDLRLLDLSLRSICRQTYRDLEIILVDDASDTADSAAIAALAGMDPRIACVRLPRNAGPYAGRNHALSLASGCFICIQDGDDYAHPQRIATQMAWLAAEPTAMLCTTAHLRIDAHATLQFEHTLDLLGDGTMTSMFRRSTIDVLGPFAPVRSRGDVEYRERLLASFGRHAHVHVACPLTFCFAAPTTLSNSVATTMPAYLSLFRDAFAKRQRYPVVAGRRVDPHDGRICDGRAEDDTVTAPWPLRAPDL